MSFGQAVRSVLSKYAEFKGRASRSEFWWWVLFYALGSFVLLAVVPKLVFLWEIAFLIPNLAVFVRRMHDSDQSGWWYFCPVVNVVFTFFPSTPGPNRFDLASGVAVVDETQLSAGSTACPACGKLRLPGQNFCQACGHQFS